MKEHAHGYRALGYSVIPVGTNKKPLVDSWKEFQTRRATEEEIDAWWENWPKANIGLVTGQISNFVAIDVDSVEGQNQIEKILPPNFKSPIVQTPSGFYHIYCAWQKGLRNNVKIIDGVDFRADGGYVVAPPSKNGKGGYTWIHDPYVTPLAPLPDQYLKILQKNKDNPFVTATGPRPFTFNLTKGQRNDTLFCIANHLVKGGMLPAGVTHVIRNLAIKCDPPLDFKEADKIIESAVGRNLDFNQSLASEIREWIDNATGEFHIRDIHNDLNIRDRMQKKYVYNILAKMVKANKLGKNKKRNGLYIVADPSLQPINWMDASTKDFGLVLPFDLSRLVKLYPKNIVIIAGEQNAGKTAIMLNIIKDNMNLHKTTLFSSETSDSELKSRLIKFTSIPLTKWNFFAYERANDFHEVIDPDGLNIIDYMEVGDEFWKVSQQIADIHHKLHKGMAVIGLQKKRGTDVGRGGEFTLEKPRLYLSVSMDKDLQQHVIKIVKAKDYYDHLTNPNGLYRYFTIAGGCDLISQSNWQRL